MKSENSLRKVQMEVKNTEKAEDEALYHVEKLTSKDLTNYATTVNDELMQTAENSIVHLTLSLMNVGFAKVPAEERVGGGKVQRNNATLQRKICLAVLRKSPSNTRFLSNWQERQC
ncbi:hypothetical protein ANCCAN_06437 [Ancylostoma caninum]|uniref:Uncharacterized protein n=1 Tax=Ancylostoma caninum TaxID=29170 RepID=A0A368GT92_ANCCA|nr:hypothetical protein ANCCAN_06437 [Ancylostoma caninum]